MAADWEKRSPAELLDNLVVLTPAQIAYVVGFIHTRGKNTGRPDRRAALELIKTGRLPLVDSDQPITRWTVSAGAVRNYIDGATTGRAARTNAEVA